MAQGHLRILIGFIWGSGETIKGMVMENGGLNQSQLNVDIMDRF